MTDKKNKQELITPNSAIELAKETTTSVIAVRRESEINVDFLNPKELDETYAVVPEVTRTIDLRGSAIISKGFEVTARDDSQEALDYASICLGILNNSGGEAFIELWQKNADLYGNGYIELVEDGSSITKLVPVHAYNFGYELEEYVDPADNQLKTRIKLDNDTQEPVGFAEYEFNESKGILENKKTFELEKISHLKYKVIGDAIYGISIVQPMQGSVVRKLQMEGHMESAGRLVSSPKIVISGKFPTEQDARREAKEAASLDVSDVVILDSDEGKSFEIINPGNTNLPQLREIFVINITTASGIPRPILTSESSEINKSTMQELMKQLRENMRSNMNKMKNLIEKEIFTRIGEKNGISNYANIIPIFTFPDDTDTEETNIIREERKAATITSLTNSLTILNNMMLGGGSTPANSEMKDEISTSMTGIFATLEKTLETFTVNNDQNLGQIEEMPIGEDGKPITSTGTASKTITKTDTSNQDAIKLDVWETGIPEQEEMLEVIDEIIATLTDEEYRLNDPALLLERHYDMHKLYDLVRNGAEIYDSVTERIISLSAIVKRHEYYIHIMERIGNVHEYSEIGKELDELL